MNDQDRPWTELRGVLTVVDGRIMAIEILADASRLTHLDVPALVGGL